MIVLTAWICHNIMEVQDTLLSPFASIIQGIYTLEIAEFWNFLKPILLKTGQKWTLLAMATVMTKTQNWYQIFLFLTKVSHLAKFHQNLRDAMSSASIVNLWFLYRDTLKVSNLPELCLFADLFVCLCWGLTSQSTIFQSCRDGATASWVINQYFPGVKCLAQGHNTAAVGFEPPTSRSGVRHSTTEPPRSPAYLQMFPFTPCF